MLRSNSFSRSTIASWIGVAVVFVLLVLVAPWLLTDFRLSLLAKFLAFAIVAIAIDLLWGYAGVLSLGHGVFFGLGAYAMAMYLKLEAAGDQLPDFMAWSGLRALPWFWTPFQSPVFAVIAAVALPMLLALLLGFFAFRSRLREVYFALMTQALALIATILLVGQQPYTGGTNGMTNFQTILSHPLAEASTRHALYLITVGALAGCYLLVRALTRSQFGKVLIALRDDEARVRFLGYDPVRIKLLVYTISAGLAGLAGALFVPQVGIISPAMIGIVPSIEMVIWVAIGGRGTLFGAIVGALVVNAAKSGFSESFPDAWQYFLGMLFVGVVLLFPAGLVGTIIDLWQRFRRRERGSERSTYDAPRPESRAAEFLLGLGKPRPSTEGDLT